MSGLFPDLKQFNRLMGKYTEVLSPANIKKVLSFKGLQSVREAKRRIDQSVDTRGNPFVPIKAPRKPLFKTRTLYNAFGFESSPTKLMVFNSVSYFSFHNFGTRFITQRQTLDEQLELDTAFEFIKKEIDSIK